MGRDNQDRRKSKEGSGKRAGGKSQGDNSDKIQVEKRQSVKKVIAGDQESRNDRN